MQLGGKWPFPSGPSKSGLVLLASSDYRAGCISMGLNPCPVVNFQRAKLRSDFFSNISGANVGDILNFDFLQNFVCLQNFDF